MTDNKKETLTEVWLRRIKNNRIVAALIILSIAIAGISAFTESASKLYHILFQARENKAELSDVVNYTVEIAVMPATANQGASLQPSSVRLELHGDGPPQVLKIANYPTSRLFIWSPKTSKDVILSVSVGEIELEKKYPGQSGFPEFLREFHKGYRAFRPNEFGSGQSGVLKKYGVEFVNVSFNIRGAEPIIRYTSQKKEK
jgi:type VI secretion system protein ImpL